VSTSTPVWPSTIASARPPTRIAAVGFAHAAASMTVRHQPSADEAVSASHAEQARLGRLVGDAVEHDAAVEGELARPGLEGTSASRELCEIVTTGTPG
jgi:hypothetical protein